MIRVRCYFDHNASSPLRPEAREAVIGALDLIGNASSVHAEGRAARALIEDAREQVARLLGASTRRWCSPAAAPRRTCWRYRRAG